MEITKRKYYKLALSIVMIMLLCVTFSAPIHAEGKNGWSNGYYYSNGKILKKKWIEDRYGKYYIGSSGKMITGWSKIKNRYYYFNEAEGGILRNNNRKTGVMLSKLSNNVLTIGIDMSQWQGRVNWQKIKKSGVDFVMLRLGYGKGRYGNKSYAMDTKFQSYVEGAQSVGLPIGIYFYSYAKNPKEAQAEAEFTIEKLNGIDVSFPIAYDFEDPSILQATDNETRTEMARTFMETIAAAGYTPMFYMNKNWYDNYIDADKLSKYEFWYARYTYEEPNRNEYNYGMWQATSTQKMSGITENTVDLNFLYKDYFNLVDTRDCALKYGWHEENGERYYYYQGKRLKTGWFAIAGEQYYLRKGAAITGWNTLDGHKYYFNNQGEMQNGFTKVDGKIYLLNTDGVLQTTTDEQGVTIREDGSCAIKKGWYKNKKGQYFYRYSSGKIATKKWIKTKGKKYYVDEDGYRMTGLKKIKNKKYYFNEKGVMQTGWITYKNNRYYFKSNGQMQTGWMRYKGKKYYFKKNGKMVRGQTVKINGKNYTFNEKGHLK